MAIFNNKSSKKGLEISRKFTKDNHSPFDQFEYEKRVSEIKNPDGGSVFHMDDVEVPKGWSQVATDILAQKYFRKAGVPREDGTTGSETSVKQTVHRVVNCWKVWGKKHGYFNTDKDANIFYDELCYMMLNQSAAPNSPQWFNTGLHESYGIDGPPQGHYYVDPDTKETKQSTSAYERPQPHACFILSVNDDLVNEGGIMDLWVREARIFKYGSGVGTNFSNIRGSGESLSGGGSSSGLMSFLKIGDRAAGAIKSGGTTRRAAKMVILDIDHPEILEFINWKKEEERKVAALIEAGYSSDYEGDAYKTVSGQNSNNSVRITAEFMNAVKNNDDWNLISRVDGEVVKTVKARELWNAISDAAWSCADPGLQFHTTINDWHTCPKGGEIRGSNPCSEYMFLDDTACNLASINLGKFFDDKTCLLDVEGFKYATRLWTIALEISVLMAQFPSKEIAELSYKYRTLGLGFANLGSILMIHGIPYDSRKATNMAACISSIMTATAYETSAEIAKIKGAFDGYEENKEDMLRVIGNHRAAAYDNKDEYEQISIIPIGINQDTIITPKYLLDEAKQSWDKALEMGTRYGFRNAQTTVIAPTGTIGLLMDCDTTGVEPDFSLIKYKKLSGGGYFKIVNQSVAPALRTLNYKEDQIEDILSYIEEIGTIEGAPLVYKYQYPIFDCANKCGNGERFIHQNGHINMMAAVQPFISGAISKTINLPNDATIEDIKECYQYSYDLGLKAISLYRDGCKLSQPLESSKKASKIKSKEDGENNELSLNQEQINQDKIKIMEVLNKLNKANEENKRGTQKRLPNKRKGFTQKARIDGQTLFLRTGEYEDGQLGEIFIDIHKEGATLKSMLNCFAIAISIGLQYGVPLEEFVEKFTFTRFEPSGLVDHPNIKSATSLVDYIFRLLAFEYLGRNDLVQVYDKDNAGNNGQVSKLDTAKNMINDLINSDKPSDNQISEQLTNMMGDAPACNVCGHITIRNGTCYKCLNCGNSMGCS